MHPVIHPQPTPERQTGGTQRVNRPHWSADRRQGRPVDRPPLDDGEQSGEGSGTNVHSTLPRTDGSIKRTP